MLFKNSKLNAFKSKKKIKKKKIINQIMTKLIFIPEIPANFI